MSSKLTSTLQQIELLRSEHDTARAQMNSSINENQMNHSALVAATQHISQLDSTLATLRSENIYLKRENESLTSELKKLQSSNHTTSDRLGKSDNHPVIICMQL